MHSVRILVKILIVIILPTLVVAQDLMNVDDLPKKHRTWLEEEVVYIITEDERNAFLKITENDLRETFIEKFWEIRDPTPGTRANEFQIEHYKRIEYANKYYGIRSAQNGWRSDRGKYHILLGKPKQRTEYPNNTLVYPAELWFYQMPANTTGSVNFFYLIFFRKHGAGDFVLYHPVLDGPNSLTWKGGFGYDNEEVNQALFGLDPDLAFAARGYDPLNPDNALASEVLIGQIDAIPENTIDDSWAEKFVETKGEVVVNYSFVPIELNVPIAVHSNMDKQLSVHYGFSIDPKNIDAGQHEDRYFLVFEVIPSLADKDGNVIYEQTKTSEINWTESDFKNIANRSLMITDFFPAIPGDYTFTLRVRNKVSRKFYLHTQSLSIPDPKKASFRLTPLLLNHKYERVAEQTSTIVPFKFFNVAYNPNSKKIFTNQQAAYLFTELYFPVNPDGSRSIGTINFKFNIYQDNELVKELSHSIPEQNVNNVGIVYFNMPIPLEGLSAGQHRLDLIVSDSKLGLEDKKTAYFRIDAPKNVAHPSVFAMKSKTNINELEQIVIRAIQFKNARNFDEATMMFEEVLAVDKGHLSAAVNYGEMLLREKENPEAAHKVLRAASQKHPNDEELVLLLAECAEKQGEWDTAAGYYERLVFINPENVDALNASAKVAIKTGNTERAKERLEKSLKLDPKQPEITKLLESIG
jgi:GWxTD domain-containing protein